MWTVCSSMKPPCYEVTCQRVCRQGVLPFPKFWASTRPFGTPFGPYTVKWGLTMIMILAPPAGDAFNFVVNLSIYPSQAFLLALAVGLYLVRWERKKAGIAPSNFRAWDVAIIFSILVNIYCLVMPWYPPLVALMLASSPFGMQLTSLPVLECKSFPNNPLLMPADYKLVLSSALCTTLRGCTSYHTLENTLSDRKPFF